MDSIYGIYKLRNFIDFNKISWYGLSYNKNAIYY